MRMEKIERIEKKDVDGERNENGEKDKNIDKDGWREGCCRRQENYRGVKQ
jgi:hypothetical protein